MQCGATEYKGTTLGITKQAFRYILLHQIKIVKMIKALFYKGLGAKKRKRVRGYDNSTYPKGGVWHFIDRFDVNISFVLLSKFCGEIPALRVAAKR